MKKLITSITLFGLIFSRGAFAAEVSPLSEDTEMYYSSEEDDYFNKGKFVGKESDDYLRARRRVRNKNWALALGTTAIGIATLVLVGKNHHHK